MFYIYFRNESKCKTHFNVELMMFQILGNVNSRLIKFKRLGVSTNSGHPTFWHCLWHEFREPFWKSKILLCCSLGRALQPSDDTHGASTPGLLKAHCSSCLFRGLAQLSSPVLKAMFFSFQFHNQVMKSSFYDFPACPESASNLVTLYRAGGLTYL